MSNILPEVSSDLPPFISAHSVSQDVNSLLTLKARVLDELQTAGFPNLQFLFSPEGFAVAKDILEDLLKQEKDEFQQILDIKQEDITFDIFLNTSVLEYYFTLLEHYLATNRNPELEDIMDSIREPYDGFIESQMSSTRYYEMLCYALKNLELSWDQERILKLHQQEMEHSWVHLDEEKKEELIQLKVELWSLAEDFMKYLTQARREISYNIQDESVISRLPQNLKDVWRTAAEQKWYEGYLFECNEGNTSALLKFCDDTDMRKTVFISLQTLAESQNTDIVLKIIALRQKMAHILWYAAYSQTVFQNKMALDVQTIGQTYEEKATVYRKELEWELSQIKDLFWLNDISAWDYLYYKEKFKESQRNISEDEFQKYREFKSVLAWIFRVFEKVFGVSFQNTDITTYDSDVEVYEVAYNNQRLWYYMPDFFSRSSKRQGAWADVLRKSVTGDKIVTNVANFTKSVQGNTYLTEYHIRIMLHELGHMLHELLSPQSYWEISGFQVEADAIEIPSKFMENLFMDPESMRECMQHENTQESIWDDMIGNVIQEMKFWHARWQLERIERAFLDFALHGADIPKSKEELQSLSFSLYQRFSPLWWFWEEDYNISSSFHHLFSSATSMYASGYYSYVWSDILQEQIWLRVKEQGSIFWNPMIHKYMDEMLSQGARKPSMQLFQKVLGV